jgi:hypothetical protein
LTFSRSADKERTAFQANNGLIEEDNMIGELLSGMAHSSGPGFVGVSLIFIYLAWIITIGCIRVKEAMNEDHH